MKFLLDIYLLQGNKNQAKHSLNFFRNFGDNCNLKSVSAGQYREELIRDSFINGLFSPIIRQRLLENSTLDLKSAFDQANALDLAQKNAKTYYAHYSYSYCSSRNGFSNKKDLESSCP